MKKLVLLAILAGLVTFSLIVLVRQQNKTPSLPLQTRKPAATRTSQPPASVSPAPSSAIIQGSLSYPSEGIPEQMKICAQSLQTNDEFCTTNHLQSPQFTYGVGYQLTVSPGSYEVYAFLPEQPDYKAYYSEAVPCGLSVDCTSHRPIPVQVAAGETVTKIDPQDWYAPPQE